MTHGCTFTQASKVGFSAEKNCWTQKPAHSVVTLSKIGLEYFAKWAALMPKGLKLHLPFSKISRILWKPIIFFLFEWKGVIKVGFLSQSSSKITVTKAWKGEKKKERGVKERRRSKKSNGCTHFYISFMMATFGRKKQLDAKGWFGGRLPVFLIFPER